MKWPFFLGGAAIASAALLFSKRAKAAPVVGSSEGSDMVKVTLPNGEIWEVAPNYVGPVGIGEAATLAEKEGFQLPTSELVDAIFNASDLKIEPPVRNHDGTPKTMSTQAVFDDQLARIDRLVGGRSFALLSGPFKDVIMLSSGKPGLYGWNVEDAAGFTKRTGIPVRSVRGASGIRVLGGAGVVQQEFGGHGLDWKDYSQGARFVRRIA